jgi:hypothetical protein
MDRNEVGSNALACGTDDERKVMTEEGSPVCFAGWMERMLVSLM